MWRSGKGVMEVIVTPTTLYSMAVVNLVTILVYLTQYPSLGGCPTTIIKTFRMSLKLITNIRYSIIRYLWVILRKQPICFRIETGEPTLHETKWYGPKTTHNEQHACSHAGFSTYCREWGLSAPAGACCSSRGVLQPPLDNDMSSCHEKVTPGTKLLVEI